MSIESHFQVAFDCAVRDPDNIREDGSVDWNFVDADLYMANDNLIKEIGFGTYKKLFNDMADAYEALWGIDHED